MCCSDSFHVDVILEAQRARMRCSGELDVLTTPILTRCLEELLDARHAEVELDFSAVRCIDSTAISAVMDARKVFAARRACLFIGRSNPRIDRVLDVLRLRHLTHA